MPELRVNEKTQLTYRQWNVSLPKAILLLVHGLGAHSERWNFLADFFLERGFSSYAIELRGFGQTPGLKGDVENFNIYYDDIRSLCGIIQRENPGKNIFLIGESMGALLSFLMAAQEADLFNGLILISPVFKSRLKLPHFYYWKIFLSLFYEPQEQFYLPFNSKMCTQDSRYQKTMDLDSREHRLATARLLVSIAFSQIRAQFLKNRVHRPILFLLSGKDELADMKTSRRFFQSLKSEDKEIILYPEMLHALSIELGRKRVFEDISRWIEKRI